MIADKFGVDHDKAAEIAGHLQSQGHDVPSLLQSGASADTMKGLLGDRAQSMLGGIPGVGGMLGGMFGGHSESAPAATSPGDSTGYAVANTSNTTTNSGEDAEANSDEATEETDDSEQEDTSAHSDEEAGDDSSEDDNTDDADAESAEASR